MPESDSTRSEEFVLTFSIIPEWVLDHKNLSHGAVRLYGILGRYANKEGVCWPSRTTLANRLRCTPITIDRWAAELVKVEALTITRRKGETTKNNLTNLWKIHKVVSSVLPPHIKNDPTLISQMMQRTRTKELKPKKDKTQLLDELIQKENL